MGWQCGDPRGGDIEPSVRFMSLRSRTFFYFSYFYFASPPVPFPGAARPLPGPPLPSPVASSQKHDKSLCFIDACIF